MLDGAHEGENFDSEIPLAFSREGCLRLISPPPSAPTVHRNSNSYIITPMCLDLGDHPLLVIGKPQTYFGGLNLSRAETMDIVGGWTLKLNQLYLHCTTSFCKIFQYVKVEIRLIGSAVKMRFTLVMCTWTLHANFSAYYLPKKKFKNQKCKGRVSSGYLM